MLCIMGSALQRIFIWQWCDHWFAQKRPTATRHRIANNISLVLASKHAHAIGAISNSIHMLTALHRARAMGICQWNTSRSGHVENGSRVRHLFSCPLRSRLAHTHTVRFDKEQEASVANKWWPKAASCLIPFLYIASG